MELRHLRYFVALADRLNFTRAAALVHVSQSTLSHQIKQLEDELGTILFDRNAKRVALTPEGELFLARSLDALNSLDEGVRLLSAPSAAPVEGKVRVGVTPTFSATLIPKCVAALLTRHPSVRAVVKELTPEAIREDLIRGELDIGIAYPPLEKAGLSSEPLFDEEMVVVVRAGHPLARKRRIRLVDLHRQGVVLPTGYFSIREVIDGYFLAGGAEPRIAAEIDSFAATFALLGRLDLAAIVPESAVPATGDFHSIPIERPFARRTATLYLKRGARQSLPVRELSDLIRLSSRERRGSKNNR